jgi:drug/metabolite transporter (DMT)-like permease
VIKAVSGRLSAFYIMTVRTAVAAVIALLVFAIVAPESPLELPAGTVAILLGSGLVAIMGDSAFVRAMAVEDVSKVFTVSTSLYILLSVAGSVVFMGDSLSWLLVLSAVAVLLGARLVVDQPSDVAILNTRGQRQPMFALWLGVLAALFWSMSLLAVSEAMESVEPLSATALRLPFMALALGLIAGLRGEHKRTRDRRDLGLLAISGVLIVGAMLLFLLSAKSSSAGTVAVLTSTSPIFVAPLAHFFLNERLTLRIASGTMSCMLGIWLASI